MKNHDDSFLTKCILFLCIKNLSSFIYLAKIYLKSEELNFISEFCFINTQNCMIDK